MLNQEFQGPFAQAGSSSLPSMVIGPLALRARVHGGGHSPQQVADDE